jgi:hypothetical protein
LVTEATLNAYLGQHISQICGIGYSSDSDNHCAHFVSHVLGYQFGVTCRTMIHGRGTPASIRVQEVFARCLQVGPWDDLPTPLFWGLVFITNATNVNVQSRQMQNVPRKHIGIFLGGSRQIWHYSNSRRQVVSQTPAEFSHHYPAPDNAMFWGSAPP